ncbi:MAG TPA: CDP-alcohol phosphatidyltransferase family protein [Acidimicrobiales bacterium]|nr:CDP-alcohol phosphatidyltransferase family protein [Acidimicrobiales bacterium]
MSRQGEDRILTVPNVLSLGRLLCIPVFLWLLFGKNDRYAAALLLAAIGITDFADGYIARHFHQESKLGKVLDPAADRIMLAVAVIAVFVDGSMPWWVASLAAAREILVAGGVLLLAALGCRSIVNVKLVGKAGAWALMMAFPLFLASNPDGGAPWHALARPLAWVCAVPGLVLAWYSAWLYVPEARAALGNRPPREAVRSGS